jgi:hypothetical protein
VALRKSSMCRGYGFSETTAWRGCGRIFNLAASGLELPHN